MAEETKGIFISYRHSDTAGYAGRLAERLEEHFSKKAVFRDIDSIAAGADFVDAIERAIGSSEVLLAVIGRNWATAPNAAGQKRLQDPQDYVRMEIVAALQRNIRVIPVLVQGASMPSAHELPNDLAPLARRNGFELHETSWTNDVQRLITTLEPEAGQSRRKEQPTREKEVSEAAARNIKATISDFLEFMQARDVWKEGPEYRDIAESEQMRKSVQAIRARLTDDINSLRRENYENLKLLIDIQDACLMLLKTFGRNIRRLKAEPTFGETEFFDEVYPRLSDFQTVVVERGLQLCKDQNLCGESPCRGRLTCS